MEKPSSDKERRDPKVGHMPRYYTEGAKEIRPDTYEESEEVVEKTLPAFEEPHSEVDKEDPDSLVFLNGQGERTELNKNVWIKPGTEITPDAFGESRTVPAEQRSYVASPNTQDLAEEGLGRKAIQEEVTAYTREHKTPEEAGKYDGIENDLSAEEEARIKKERGEREWLNIPKFPDSHGRHGRKPEYKDKLGQDSLRRMGEEEKTA